MQHYIYIKRSPRGLRHLSSGLYDDELSEEWRHKAKALRIRRERLVKQHLRTPLTR